ncbi:MAG: hypothetical protein RL328_366 [Acidobacteriota bacterium]|jgi:predicted  nucleic acid-binding Zn-ribbon protein
MHADVALVLQLQQLDHRMGLLEKEVAELPRHIATIEKTLESHIRRLEADKAALAANQRDRKNLDLEVQTQKQKISKLRDQMSQAKTNEQYRAFQHEIEYAEKEISKLDDRGLELMSAAEPLDAAVKAAEASLKEEQKTVESEKVKARQATSADQIELEKLRAEHKETFAKLPRTSQAAYERIRKKWKSTAASEVKDGRCTACQMMLRPQYYQDLRKGDNLMFCETCSRFLYYQAPDRQVDMS